MKTKEEYLADLRLFKEKFAAKYGIRSIGIFGSVARGEHRDDSDLDVFVELEEPDFYTMHDIRDALQQICGCKVDLLRLREGLRELLIKRIEKDALLRQSASSYFLNQLTPVFSCWGPAVSFFPPIDHAK